MESTTTSLHAVPSDPTTVAMTAAIGERTTTAIASQDALPDQAQHSIITSCLPHQRRTASGSASQRCYPIWQLSMAHSYRRTSSA